MIKKTTRKMFDEDSEGFQFPVQSKLYARELFAAYSYEYPIGEVSYGDTFQELVNVLRSASEQDQIVLTICSPGGSLTAAQALIAEIRCSEATVVARIAGECSSAGTLIALACNVLEIDEDTSCLFHSMSFGVAPAKAADVELYATHNKALNRRVMQKAYEGFLSQQEIEDILKGFELLIFGDEFATRWDKREAYFKALEEAEADALEEDEEDLLEEEFEEPFPLLTKSSLIDAECSCEACSGRL